MPWPHPLATRSRRASRPNLIPYLPDLQVEANKMPKLLGVVGALVICAGLDLLWQSRREIRFWASAYLQFFRAVLRHEQPQRVLPVRAMREKRRGAVRFLLGMSFAFLLAPTLIAIGLTLMYTNF